jgi:two-component system cell cycle sensor histidine kinase/response regulator CckA
VNPVVPQSPELYRILFEQALDGIFLADADGTYVAVNESGHRMLGYEPGGLVGKSILDILPPEEHARLAVELQGVKAGRPLRSEWDFVRRDGSRFRGEVSGKQLDDGLLLGLVRDVTSRHRAEQALRESEELLNRSQEMAHVGSWRWDLKTGKVVWSEEMCRIHGLPPGGFPGTLEAALPLHPEDRERVSAEMAAMLAAKRPKTFDYRIVRPDGAVRHLHGLGRFVFDAAGEIAEMLGTVLDVTEQREAERARAELELQLRQTQRLESLGRIAGGVAHDFNNLLTAIIGFAEMARAALPTDEEAAGYLARIVEGGRRGADLTQRLLAYARKKVIQPEHADLGGILSTLEPMFRRLLDDHIELRIVRGPSDFPVLVDVGSVEQVLMNLVLNARDAMPQGGRLTIELSRVLLDDAFVAGHPESRPGVHVLLGVTDTGVGMEPEILARIFEPFFTTKPMGQGTGLGLAMCDGIVKQAGGFILAESRPGLGTTLKVFLPVSEGPVQRPAPAPPVPGRGKGERILLVEDDPLIRESSARILQGCGYRVVPAADGTEALRTASETSPPFDLVVTDVVMPQMGGRELAAALRRRDPGARILYTSGYAESIVVRKGVPEEGIELLQKPYSAAELSARVRRALDAPGR